MKDIIYLINGDENRYKIGISSVKGLQNRVKNLQTGSSAQLNIIFTVETKYASIIEKVLHRKLNHKKLIGEWFELNPDDVFTFTETCINIEKNIKLLEKENNDYIIKTINKKNKI